MQQRSDEIATQPTSYKPRTLVKLGRRFQLPFDVGCPEIPDKKTMLETFQVSRPKDTTR